ncbi:hypothetical protein BAUCODRAFT_96468 [Baudoinia panamericana UAMH 10762]|uniref:Uncharacterized protein n=1 Tax=Baudoinia panamericana (strain UAMH 10762) TaxID=717646 RepID=M2N211_BAUPA|nr:uncharacterized protein BAUCODRAFT_96468 [Baudoinia panamericana UAMH 10762]EMC92999.1 hypothetical protein BAUCODRAFT_96468 [Baudoinia panamericana UAMH 10762]
MTGLEVIGCVASVVSAFHGAAELIQMLKERKEKKKKRKQEEIERIIEAKMLHQSLVQGEQDCERCSAEGQQRFGHAFNRGDDIAVSQLKDVVIHLQGEVIRALQIAMAVESAVLNVPRLHESSILDRTTAVRSMQDLCQRIAMRMPPQRYLGGEYADFGMATSGITFAGVHRSDTAERAGRLSLNDSVRLGSEAGSSHQATESVGSMTDRDDHAEGETGPLNRIPTTLSGSSAVSPEPLTPSSSAASTRSVHLQEPDREMARSSSAPEVVTKGYESLMSRPPRPSLHAQPSSIPPRANFASFGDLQPGYAAPSPVVESEEPWLPWDRPTSLNNYHGFCKGAWLVRSSPQSGLSIAMLTDNSGQQAPYWKCKHCAFRSKATAGANHTPDQIYFAKSGIRYRWLFLAKSHVPAQESFRRPENYAYACIFCAAQGHSGAAHVDLDSLLWHITAKHKTTMMTPEVRSKTRCIVGGTADRTDETWDINLPETIKRSMGTAFGGLVIGAVTGIPGYGDRI